MDDVTSEQRCCEVCGDPIHRDNVFGICVRTPECRTARNRAKRRSMPRPEPKSCEVCGRSIRSDNETGICQRLDSPECQRARDRRNGQNPLGKNHFCEICGRLLRRDNSMGICDGKRNPACAQERDRRRGWRRGVSAVPEDWAPPPYIAAGTVFGRLTVLEDVWRSQDPVRCRCEEGNEKLVGRAVYLTIGSVRSCGCLRRDLLSTHGLSKHPLYRTWSGIVSRTTNPNDDHYPNYGGRGIRMSERWLDDPQAFLEDIEREIGPRPEGLTEAGWPMYTLDRIDVEGHYEPGNVQWGSWADQAMNKRKIPDLTRRDALAAEVEALTAQIQALTEQARAPRQSKVLAPPAEDALF